MREFGAEEVAGAGRKEDESGWILALRVDGVGSKAEGVLVEGWEGRVGDGLELWNSRSSWRSVWPRSPCAASVAVWRALLIRGEGHTS